MKSELQPIEKVRGVLSEMDARRYPDMSTEQSILYNLNAGCDAWSVAKVHDMSITDVQTVWLQMFGELAGLKFCRWSQLSDMAAGALKWKLDRRFSTESGLDDISELDLLKIAKDANDIARNNAQLALDIQRLPQSMNVGGYTPLQRDVYFEIREILTEQEIVGRARMGNHTLRRICEQHDVSWEGE